MLGDGSSFGINLSYETQPEPKGLAEALIIGENFIGNNPISLVLGDNIFWGNGLVTILNRATQNVEGATIFGYFVRDPHRFGIVEFDETLSIKSIEEKPQTPKSNYAVTGLYFYDNDAPNMAKEIRPSHRGELEITSLNNMYLDQQKLKLELLGRGFAWLDTGTHESLMDAARFVETIEARQGLKIACLEEIAWSKGWLSDNEIAEAAAALSNNSYGQYLQSLLLHSKSDN